MSKLAQINHSIVLMLTETIKKCLEEARPFSAYNITLITREREKIRLRHTEMQGVVHEIDLIADTLDFGYTTPDGTTLSWQRSEFTKWAGPAFQVYHPVGYNLDNFVPEGVNPVSQAEFAASVRPQAMIGVITPNADGTTPNVGGEQADGTFQVDNRNRLMVPTKFLKEAGISAGDSIYVIADSKSKAVFLAKDAEDVDNDGIGVTMQLVERCGDIRLSNRTLKSAHLEGSNFSIKNSEKDFDGVMMNVVEITQA
jgi:bifunctional DNA-binding transcriptional regulator/antitoxin component of YhaV-PrlF toxin-antitoxin module